MNRQRLVNSELRRVSSNPILGIAMASLIGALVWSALVALVLLIAG